jgi:capsular polysaccharide transport system ATP-binding protein
MIELHRVTKCYETPSGPKTILDDVSFCIGARQSMGILGRNGAGKSTLIRVIAGVEHATSGRISRTMSVSWPLGFSGGFQGTLTGADNVRFIARIYGRPIDDMLTFVDDFAELGSYMRMPVKTYSSGMRARLAFATSLAVDFDCYLIDEITAVGDSRFHRRCHDALGQRRGKGTLVMVSHSPDTLRAYCDTGALLEGGRLTFFDTINDALYALEAH